MKSLLFITLVCRPACQVHHVCLSDAFLEKFSLRTAATMSLRVNPEASGLQQAVIGRVQNVHQNAYLRPCLRLWQCCCTCGPASGSLLGRRCPPSQGAPEGWRDPWQRRLPASTAAVVKRCRIPASILISHLRHLPPPHHSCKISGGMWWPSCAGHATVFRANSSGLTVEATRGAFFPGMVVSGSSSKSAASRQWLGLALQSASSRARHFVGRKMACSAPSDPAANKAAQKSAEKEGFLGKVLSSQPGQQRIALLQPVWKCQWLPLDIEICQPTHYSRAQSLLPHPHSS